MRNLRKIPCDNKCFNTNYFLATFDRYLDLERGLAQTTRYNYCLYIRVFLNTQTICSKNAIKNLSPKDIYKFILAYSQEGKPRRTQYMIGSLRVFFRFLGLFDLANSLPSVPYHKSSLPEYLSHDQLQALLEGCNKNTVKGLRDYTILMVLICLGLRRSEVSQLTLNDFNWDRGEVVIRGKGSISCMPISQSLGHALVDYLKHARPKCSSVHFFTHVYHPFTGLSPQTVSDIVRDGLKRAGIHTKHKGVHLLRHSFATQLLNKGKSLLEISMALRHKNIETTTVYAHVDFDKLRSVALPWPIVNNEVDYE